MYLTNLYHLWIFSLGCLLIPVQNTFGRIASFKHTSDDDTFNWQGQSYDPNWHLERHKIPSAWQQGYTGAGVTVGVVDDGVDMQHITLQKSLRPHLSYDYAENSEYLGPLKGNNHGTKCAGIIGADYPGLSCGHGIAKGVNLVDVRLLTRDYDSAREAAALNHSSVDILSCSWGPSDSGMVFDGPKNLTQLAFLDGVIYGRNGLGILYVFAAGNGGFLDTCSADGYSSSLFTMAISSVSFDHQYPPYTESCPSIFASTFSSGTSEEPKICAALANSNCTCTFSRTSASAPMAAAMMALALEANPALTWRDARHLLVVSSNSSYLQTFAESSSNGVGLLYNPHLGFGVMDADRLVRYARIWKNVDPMNVCMLSTNKVIRAISAEADSWQNTTIFVACDSPASAVHYIEHVTVRLSLWVERRGAVEIYLVSPMGTVSLLLPRRKFDFRHELKRWPFHSVQFWGEAAGGVWTLAVRNVEAGRQPGVLSESQMIIYGTRAFTQQSIKNYPIADHATFYTKKYTLEQKKAMETDVIVNSALTMSFTNKFKMDAEYFSGSVSDEHSLVCHRLCREACYDLYEAPACSTCCSEHTQRMSHCKQAEYLDVGVYQCSTCAEYCGSCFGPAATQCVTCAEGMHMDHASKECVPSCPDRTYLTDGNLCYPCAVSCGSCTVSESHCTSCRTGFTLDGVTCVETT